MMVISLTQRFFLCTETGSESVDIRDEKGMFGLVAAALLELDLSGCVCIEKKKVRACAPLSEGCAPLAPLYNYIRRKGPLSVGKIAPGFVRQRYSAATATERFAELAAAAKCGHCVGTAWTGAKPQWEKMALHLPNAGSDAGQNLLSCLCRADRWHGALLDS